MTVTSDTYGWRLIWAKGILTQPHATFLIKSHSRFGLEVGTQILSYIYVRHTCFQKLGKVLIMGDFNARVGKYQNMEIPKENIVDPCLLRLNARKQKEMTY